MKKNSRITTLFNMAILLTIANFFGKILGFLRDILISNYYGATPQTDAFFLALSIPTILIGVFTSSADSAVVPQYSKIADGEEGRLGADRYFSNIVTILTLIATAVALLSLVSPQTILLLFAPTFHGEQLAQACTFLRIFSFAGLFHIWYCFFCAYLLCYEKTTTRMILSFTTNVLVVLVLMCFRDPNMYALSIAYFLGSLFGGLLPIFASRRVGYRYIPTLSTHQCHFPEFIKLFLPIMGSALLADLLMYCDRFLSSFLEAGSLSALNYASKIVGIFDNIIVVGIGAVLLPVLTRLHIEKRSDQLQLTISAVCFCVILGLLPVALLCVFYSYDLVSVLYLRGAFTVENAQMVGRTFRAYGMQILFCALQAILIKTFHSLGDTQKPFRIYLITFISNVFLSITLMQPLKIYGIALATTISTAIGCALLLFGTFKRVGLCKEFFNVRSLGKVTLSAMMLYIPSLIMPRMDSPFLHLVVEGGIACALYILSIYVLCRREIKICLRMIKN